MRNSILSKFFIGYLSFAILGLFLITYWSANGIYNKLLQDDINTLYNYTSTIGDELMNSDLFEEDDLKSRIDIVKHFNTVLDCQVMILDNQKNVLYHTGNEDYNVDKDTNILIDKFNPDDYKAKHYKINNFYNMFQTDTLSVMSNIVIDDVQAGYVIAHMPTLLIKQRSYDVTFVFYVTYCIILALSLIILVTFAWVIYFPLKQIRLAAMEYAKGNFEYDGLQIATDDEIGDVANSLKYMSKQLNNSRNYQKQFISNISHDFRSPLTSIKGYLEAIMDGTIPYEDQNKYLSIILSEANRLEKLTDGLRELNNWNSTGLELLPEDFDMEAVITSTVDTFQGSCEKKNIELIIQFPDKPCYVTADKGKIEQVLYNLLDNAIKFSNVNSKIIIKLYGKKGDKVFCSVKDFGMGIPSDSLDKIWQRFYKSDHSRGRDKMGSGIGLSIVKEIIMAHNETIDVISTEGAGTEFVFSLRKAKAIRKTDN